MSGQTSYFAGLAAEDSVTLFYQDQGCVLLKSRWKGPGGEIDLIFRNGAEVIFVEVKNSRSFEDAAARVTERQQARIFASASAFLADVPTGQDTDARFDVALVNATGAVHILENAFGQP